MSPGSSCPSHPSETNCGSSRDPAERAERFRAVRAAAGWAGVPWAGLHTLRHTPSRSVNARKFLIPRRRASLAVEGVPRPVEQALRLLAAVADRGEADQPVPAERGHHVEHDARLGRMVEVESAPNGQVENVVRL